MTRTVVAPPRSRRKSQAAVHTPPSGAFYCQYLWDSLTVLSDGKVTCGFDDPFGTRSYGNVRTSSIRQIFNGPGVRELRQRLASGKRCATCHLYTRVEPGAPAPPPIEEMPRRLIVESTIRCQLRCRNTSCDLNNDRRFNVREEPFLPFELFTKVMDEAGPHLGTLYFFNYGEPFLHPRAVDMLAYARKVNPALSIATSTNGLLLARGGAARRIVEENLLHWINFTIAGCDDPTYQIYHKGGSFEQAIDGMRRVIEEKRRLGRRGPIVRWRYLLFNWNDSDAHIAKARALARDIGVDEFTFFLCSAPLEGRSRLRAPGTKGYAAIADAIDHEVHYYRRDTFADTGLYRPEYDDDLGAYCWTSRKATLRITPRGESARLHLCRKGEPAKLASAVWIRTPWGEWRANVGEGEWLANDLRVPRRAAGEPFEVEVEVAESFIPFRHGIHDDTRELGVMVSLAFADAAVPPSPARWPVMVEAPAGVPVESVPVTVQVAGSATVWVRNGEYAIGEGGFSSHAGVVEGASAVRVRHTTAMAPGLGSTTVLSIGGIESEFTTVTSWSAKAVEATPIGAGREASSGPACDDSDDGESREQPHEYVTRLYLGLFGRHPDAAGMQWWTRFLREGGHRAAVAEGFMASAEFEQCCAPVAGLYLAFFHRIPDLAGLAHWLARLRGGAGLEELAARMGSAGEFNARHAALDGEEFVDQAYQDLLGRMPEAAEKLEHAAAAASLADRWRVVHAIATRPEYTARSATRVRVTMAYAALVSRAPDVVGYDFWCDFLDRGGKLYNFLGALVGSRDREGRRRGTVEAVITRQAADAGA